MKEHPILFNGEMVRAILDGRKTQTRRPIKHAPHPENPYWETKNGVVVAAKQPWQVGDRLWVRETWIRFDGDGPDVLYRADADDNGSVPYLATGSGGLGGGVCDARVRRWRPSIHMPRWASRITLEVTAVRIERVQDISEREALAEGIVSRITAIPPYDQAYQVGGHPTLFPTAKSAFGWLWQSIYGNWDDNPWAWVTEFKLVEVKP